ncbi:MAG: peroxiredoxin family protein [Bacteroidota bacterium]
MNKQTFSTAAALVLGTIALAGTFLKAVLELPALEYVAVGAAALGFVMSLPPKMKLNRTQILAHEFAAIAGGVAIALSFEPPNALLGLVPVLAIFPSMAIRLQSYPALNRTTALWLEPVVALLMLGTYVAGNVLVEGMGWKGWAYPALQILMSLMVMVMTLMDRLANLKTARGGFKADVGKQAPDFELPDEAGNLVKLSDFKGQNHVLIIFYRGDWCPFCNIMLRLYKKEAHRFQDKGIVMLAIGPDDPQTNRQLVEAVGLPFHVLSDPDLSVVNQYGIRVKNHNPGKTGGENETDSPLPASFLIDKTGTVQFTSHPARVGEFLRPELIFPVLDELDRYPTASAA